MGAWYGPSLLAVLYIADENHRAVAALQIHQRSVHAAVEAIQDEGSGGEGPFETAGAGTAVGGGRRGSD